MSINLDDGSYDLINSNMCVYHLKGMCNIYNCKRTHINMENGNGNEIKDCYLKPTNYFKNNSTFTNINSKIKEIYKDTTLKTNILTCMFTILNDNCNNCSEGRVFRVKFNNEIYEVCYGKIRNEYVTVGIHMNIYFKLDNSKITITSKPIILSNSHRSASPPKLSSCASSTVDSDTSNNRIDYNKIIKQVNKTKMKSTKPEELADEEDSDNSGDDELTCSANDVTNAITNASSSDKPVKIHSNKNINTSIQKKKCDVLDDKNDMSQLCDLRTSYQYILASNVVLIKQVDYLINENTELKNKLKETVATN
jgi:hypothetical protein